MIVFHKQRMHKKGCTRCVDACKPLLVLLFPLLLLLCLPLVLIQDISGLLYMFCRVESPSGSFFEIDGLTLIRLD
jgi:hypothetical protein